ncbi:MAG: hypothetical protein WKF74_17895 [Pyrinomonadaceae bacterium]
MRWLTLKIFVAAAAFFVGVTAASIWFVHHTSNTREVKAVVPSATPPALSVTENAFADDVKSSGVKLLTTGQFHGDEVTAKTGERWLGLYPTANGYTLIRSTLRIERVHDQIVDEKLGVKTGKSVGVDQSGAPVFLVKGANMLRPRSVVTLFESSEETLGNKSVVDFKLGGVDYRLSVVSDDTRPDGYDFPKGAKLLLSSPTMTQTLFPYSDDEMDEPSIRLDWAGDLDADGKLDLYMHLNHHYNVSRAVLFLSSQAGEGQIVRAVADFITVGC